MSDSATNGKPAELVKERRAQIFEAAARIFAAKGYHKATVNEIAQEAGLGKGTLYDYIRSKREILKLLIEEGHNQVFTEVEELVKQDLSPEEKFYGAVNIQIRMLDKYRDAARALIPEVTDMESEDREWFENLKMTFITRYAQLYEDGVRAGVFRDLDSNVVCEVVCEVAALWGKSDSIKKSCNDSVELFEQSIRTIFLKGLLKKSEA